VSRATVLAYHAVGDCPPADDPHGLWVPTIVFRAQMAFLARHRRVVPLGAMVDGRIPPGPPAVAITFDDGYRSVLTNAAPILSSHRFPSTVFVPTAHVGDRNRWDPPSGTPLEIMGADELRAADAAGVAVESHGHQHVDLSDADVDTARADLEPSIDAIEALVGRRPRFVAFPFRTGSPEAQEAAATLGFDAAFTIDLPHAGRFAFGRVGIAPSDSPAIFRLKTSGRYLSLRHDRRVDAVYRSVRRLGRRR